MAYSEPYEKMDSKTLDISKAITSLREELEAVDWYNQRVATASNEELKRIMAHNRDEEKEHAAMLIEWVRRNMDNYLVGRLEHHQKRFGDRFAPCARLKAMAAEQQTFY